MTDKSSELEWSHRDMGSETASATQPVNTRGHHAAGQLHSQIRSSETNAGYVKRTWRITPISAIWCQFGVRYSGRPCPVRVHKQHGRSPRTEMVRIRFSPSYLLCSYESLDLKSRWTSWCCGHRPIGREPGKSSRISIRVPLRLESRCWYSRCHVEK